MADHSSSAPAGSSSTSGFPAHNPDSSDILRNPTLPKCGRIYNSDDRAESPWARKVILSLDGGGTRGFASLEILDLIMSEISDREHEKGIRGSSEYPWSTSPTPQEFKPHHYIDYFVGTSTGGLSSIMLGRLQKTVKDTQAQYDRVGKKVFQRPKRLVGPLGYRFDEKLLEEVLQQATQQDIGDRPSSLRSGLNIRQQRMTERNQANRVRLRTENKDLARTVVVAQGRTGAKKEPYLFRSYEHPYPDKAYSAGEVLNPGPACDLPLWIVGRATSAAPRYFKSMKHGEDEFKDGALAAANNPISLAYQEVLQMHPLHRPRLIISIGTGRKSAKDEKDKWYKLLSSQLDTLAKDLKSLKDEVMNSHQRHESFQRDVVAPFNRSISEKNQAEARSRNLDDTQTEELKKELDEDRQIHYFRFDIPEAYKLRAIKLGDWKGPDGADTKHAITAAVTQWYKNAEDRRNVQKCAQLLVKIRHERAETDRWERFAMNVNYKCPEASKYESQLFDSRVKLRRHATRVHGFVRQVGCFNEEQTPATKVAGWTCFQEECERKVVIFESLEKFRDHRKVVHGLDTQVKTDDQLEAWLDKGRNDRQETILRKETFQFSKDT